MKSIHIMACEFQRGDQKLATRFWEPGILINEGNGPIIDMEGKIVPVPVWDWRPIMSELSVIYKVEDK